MLDENVLDLAPLEGRLRSLGAEARRPLRATPPARGRRTNRQPGVPARRGALTLANNSPILYIHSAYANGRFQDASYPTRGVFARRSKEFVAKNHVVVEWQFGATDLAESWLKKRSATSICHSSHKAAG